MTSSGDTTPDMAFRLTSDVSDRLLSDSAQSVPDAKLPEVARVTIVEVPLAVLLQGRAGFAQTGLQVLARLPAQAAAAFLLVSRLGGRGAAFFGGDER